MSLFKDFTVCRAVELHPLKPRNDKGGWRKPKSTELEGREDLTSSHSAASSISSCASFSLPPPAPRAFTPALLKTIEKQPLMGLGGVSCLPPSPHLPCFDFARWKTNHRHFIPSSCPQGAETSPPPWSLPATWDCQVQRENLQRPTSYLESEEGQWE